MNRHDLQQFLTRFNIGEPSAFGGLKVFPLFPLDPPAVDYQLAGEALTGGLSRVEEAEELPGPWFRSLKFVNDSELLVLLREADLLSGGKQDRIVDQTCLVPAGSSIVVPVSCMEQRRSYGDARFAPVRSSAPADLRWARMGDIARDRDGAQGRTWADIAGRRQARGLQDGAGSLAELELQDEERRAAHEHRIPYVRGAAGLVIASGTPRRAGARTPVGIELVEIFATPEACRQAWPALVRASAGRMPGRVPQPRVSRTEIRAFFASLGDAAVSQAPQLGHGTLHRLEWAQGAGTVLEHQGRIAHAALLAA